MKGKSCAVFGILAVVLIVVLAWGVTGCVQRPDPKQFGEHREVKALIETLSYRDNPALALIGPGKAPYERAENATIDHEGYVRAEAAYWLGEIGDASAVEPLIALYHESLRETGYDGWPVRQQTIDALGKLGDPRAVETLVAALADPHPPNGRLALQALGGLEDQRATDVLKEILETANEIELTRLIERYTSEQVLYSTQDYEQARELASESLVRAGGAAGIEYLVQTQDPDALARMGETMVAPLIEALASESASVRAQAATALGRMGDQRALAPIIGLVTDPEHKVRLSAVDALWGLWELDESAAERALVLALEDPSGEIRGTAGAILAKLYRGKAVELLHYLEDEDIVGSMAWMLIYMGEEGTEQALVNALNKFGDKDMADDYLNSGNERLVEAAKRWASTHGYMIIGAPGAQSGGTWGTLR